MTVFKNIKILKIGFYLKQFWNNALNVPRFMHYTQLPLAVSLIFISCLFARGFTLNMLFCFVFVFWGAVHNEGFFVKALTKNVFNEAYAFRWV